MKAKAVSALRSKRGLRPVVRVAEPPVVGLASFMTQTLQQKSWPKAIRKIPRPTGTTPANTPSSWAWIRRSHARSRLTPFQPLQRVCFGQSYPCSLGYVVLILRRWVNNLAPLIDLSATLLASRTTPETLSLVPRTANEWQRRAACGARATAKADAPPAAAAQCVTNDQEYRRA